MREGDVSLGGIYVDARPRIDQSEATALDKT
jgi:hypothetical protein